MGGVFQCMQSHQGRLKWECDILSKTASRYERIKSPSEFFYPCYLQKHAYWYWDHRCYSSLYRNWKLPASQHVYIRIFLISGIVANSNDFCECVISAWLYTETNSLFSLFLSQFLATFGYLGSSKVKRKRICRWTLSSWFSAIYITFTIITIANIY